MEYKLLLFGILRKRIIVVSYIIEVKYFHLYDK